MDILLAVQGHKIPQGWKSTHKFVGAFMRDLQRAEDAPPLTLGSSKTVKDLKRRAENIIEKACTRASCLTHHPPQLNPTPVLFICM